MRDRRSAVPLATACHCICMASEGLTPKAGTRTRELAPITVRESPRLDGYGRGAVKRRPKERRAERSGFQRPLAIEGIQPVGECSGSEALAVDCWVRWRDNHEKDPEPDASEPFT